MNFKDIFEDVKMSFDGIWQTKERGNSLEIITPYATTNNRFISVFLTHQNGSFVISDGGWIYSGVYDVAPRDKDCFLKILYHYQNSFSIKDVVSKDGIKYHYIKTSSKVDIPSKIFDLALYIQNIVSISEIDFEDNDEKETKALFVSKANDFLRSFVNIDKIKFNAPLDPNKKEVKFNAIYHKSHNDLTLINYVTGSSYSNFSNSIFKANTLYEMAEKTVYSRHITEKITIIDTDALGFVPIKIANYLHHLKGQSGTEMIEWNHREVLKSLLN